MLQHLLLPKFSNVDPPTQPAVVTALQQTPKVTGFQVVFVATANQLQGMSGPLLDRLEIIELSGYTLDEKEHIAQVSC